ncbi:hypothetical protein CRENBAI_013457 [Crenichthys baileyi]|uniref:SH3 domain-containing protein n=1 Tax=Crenichthys baileyi TaxID=28760 RepID=A0AAV9SIM8_9TELE
MAEARSEEEEENLRRDTREQVVRRQPNSSGGRPDRRKPEQRHSQGPLSSIRAVIKRTSRSSVLETPRDRERDRDRRRPEITILAAEPLPSTSWFPGAVGGIPPPPPPPAHIWGSTIAPSVQPPPSYEEVIREKTQEQVLLPPASSSSSSPLVFRTTIATQTEPGSAPDPQETRERRAARPPRPPPPRPSNVDLNVASSQSTVSSSETSSVAASTRPDPLTHTSTHTQCSEPLADQHLPATSTCGAQTDQCLPAAEQAPPPDTSPHVRLERPRPRPRTWLGRQPVNNEVKVQTLVKLREDGLATLAARAASDGTNPEATHGTYLQELLEAFSSDDWGFPDHCSDNSEHSQSESEEEVEEEDGEDMATLRARIQAFEQQQPAADGSCGDTTDMDTGNLEGFVAAKRPEPRPRPRLQGQPPKSIPPVIAPKPKSFSPPPKPSSKVFWEDGGVTVETGNPETSETAPAESNSAAQTSEEPSAKSDPGSELKPTQTSEKPAITPKPKTVSEPLPSSTPVPAPRPPPPKLTRSVSGSPSPPHPLPPRRPPVAPRASLGAPQQEKSSVEAGGEPAQNTVTQTVKGGSIRSTVKPAAPTSPRAPNLAPKPTAVAPARPDPNPVPPKPTAVNPAAPSKPPGPPKPPAAAPAPALRKGSIPQSKAETSNPANPGSSEPSLPPRPTSVKLLPLRPPPIKSAPGRPPPPAINAASSTNQIAASKAIPAVTTSPAGQTSSSPSTANQRVARKGPPLPPRPKPGHPLFDSYMKQEVLIVLDDPNPAPAETQQSNEGNDPSSVAPLISPSLCLLDSDPQPEPVQDKDSESKMAIEDLNPSTFQSILPVQPAELKEHLDSPVSGPRCVALFDYEGEDDDELTFSQGDVIGLLQLVGEEWGRGQIHGRTGIFPLNFTEVVELLPEPTSSPGETSKQESAETGGTENCATVKPSELETDEWVLALFDFPGQTAEDLSFHKGALIQVTKHVDAEWRRGRLDGRDGLYPAAFTQPCPAQPITGQQSAAKGTAKAVFDFTAENADELTLKVGDIITHVESVDEQWILGVVGGKRGIVPRNYISLV